MSKEVEYFEDDELVTFVDEEGNEVDYVIWGELDYNDKQYAVIQPTELPDDMDDDQVMVCEIIMNDNGEEEFIFVEDDSIAEAVVEQYNRMQDEME